jgi:hypothetical protein
VIRVHRRVLVALAALLALSCSSSSSDAPGASCDPNPCTSPPASSCSGDVAVSYPSPGTCTVNGSSTSCSYAPQTVNCAATSHVCAAGACTCPTGFTGATCADCATGYHSDGAGGCVDACTAPNPCTTPPDPSCSGSVATTWADVGTCSLGATAGSFSCAYAPATEDCSTFGATCASGACVCPAGYTGPTCADCATGYHSDGAGGCADACTAPNPCTTPPEPSCSGTVATTWAGVGTCTLGTPEGTFTCSYVDTTIDCALTSQTCSAGLCVGGPAGTSAQIAAVRAASGTVSLPVDSAVVTYLRPAIGTEPEAFYLQAEQAGPALVVAVAPASLSPAPAVGDRVSLTVIEATTTDGIGVATQISGYTRVGQGFDVSSLVQDVSSATDLVSALGSYADDLVTVQGMVIGSFGAAGSGFVSAPMSTAGYPAGDAGLVLRVATTVRDALEITSGCTFDLTPVPLGHFSTTAQPTARSASELGSVSCPSPQLLSAASIDSTHVRLAFSRQIDPASVLPDGSQFTFSGGAGLTATAAAVGGASITVTTTAQASGTEYAVYVGAGVMDLLGVAVAAPASATFVGIGGGCAPVVVISQVYGGGGNSGAIYTNDFVELHNRSGSPITVTGWSIQYASAAGSTWSVASLTGTIPAGGYFLVQLFGGTVGVPLPTPDWTGTINMGGTAGKVALANGTTALSGTCPADPAIVDLVGYGATANCSEGTGPAPAPSSTTADLRQGDGCVDTGDNSLDFSVAAPTPRNGGSAALTCGCN